MGCDVSARLSLIVVAIALSSFGLDNRCPGQVLKEGFCGRDAAYASARDLGIVWRNTPQVETLEMTEIASFGHLIAALESLGLHIHPCSLCKPDIPAINAIYEKNAGNISGIAWLRKEVSVDTSEESAPGHYVIAKTLADSEDIVYYDPQSNVVDHIHLDGIDCLPLLLVSRSPIEQPQMSDTALRVGERLLQNPWTTIALVLAALLVLSIYYSGSFKVSRSTLILAGASFASLFLASILFSYFISLWKRDSDPAIAFTESVYDHGDVLVDSGESVTVSLVNGSNREASVAKVIGSCGCMSIDPSQAVLEPGERLDCIVRFDYIKFGNNHHTVTAIVDDDPVKCSIQFEGVPGVSLMPRRKLAGKLAVNSGDTLVHELRVDSYRGSPLTNVLVEPENSRPVLDFELVGTPTFADDAVLPVRVRVAADSDARGLFFERVLITAGMGDDAVTCLAEIGVEIVDSKTP